MSFYKTILVSKGALMYPRQGLSLHGGRYLIFKNKLDLKHFWGMRALFWYHDGMIMTSRLWPMSKVCISGAVVRVCAFVHTEMMFS